MNKNKKNTKNDFTEEEMTEQDLPVEETENETSEEETTSPSIDEVLAENQKLKEDYLRAFAEAENTKKRCRQEIEKNNKYAISSFAKSLLGVADNLQRAIDAAAKEENSESCANLLKGIELTQNELTKVFDKFDIHKMDIMGTIFNPNFHQVIQEVEDKSKPAGTIIAEIQAGYMIHDRILREAMVVVTKA